MGKELDQAAKVHKPDACSGNWLGDESAVVNLSRREGEGYFFSAVPFLLGRRCFKYWQQVKGFGASSQLHAAVRRSICPFFRRLTPLCNQLLVNRLQHFLMVGLLALVTASCAPTIVPSRSEPLAIVVASEQNSRAGWPQLLGPALDSRSPESNLSTIWGDAGPPVAYRTAVGRGYSAPVAYDGDVAILAREEKSEVLRVLDLETGDERWRHAWPTTYKCKYEYSDGPYSTPLIDDDRIYAVGAQAKLFCFERATGSVIWQRDLALDYQLKESLFGFGSGMLIDDDMLVMGCGGSSSEHPTAGIVALDKFTGATIWTATDHAAAYTTPRRLDAQGRQLLLVLTEVGLVTLDRSSGEVLHEYPFHSRAVDTLNAVTPQVFGSRVLMVCGPGPGAVVLDFADQSDTKLGSEEKMAFQPPREVWKDRRVLDSQFNSVLMAGDCAIGFSSSQQGGATLRCVDLATGKLRWKHTSDLDRGQIIATNSAIIALGEHGHLASLELDTNRAVPLSATSKPIFKSPCYSQPALCDGYLLVRNEHELVVFDLAATRER